MPRMPLNPRTLATLIAAACVSITPQALAAPIYTQTNLTSNIPGLAANTDPNLKNPWGMSFGATTPIWVSDQGTNVSTLYTASGAPTSLVVSTPPGPTGQVFNSTTGFELAPGDPARFIFASLSGTVSGWNPAVSATSAVTEFTATDHAAFTGLASGSSGGKDYLYAADFANGKIDVLDNAYHKVSLSGSFVDPNLPANYAPYNIANVGGKLYVEYAKVDPVTHIPSTQNNQGIVSVFNTNGQFVQRLITDTHLNSPWGVVLAPSGFGGFANDLLVGNFGNGVINAFDPGTGAFVGVIADADGKPLANDGLWALAFRSPGSAFDPNALYFVAGIHDQRDGLLGVIEPIPEPATFTTLGLALSAFLLRRKLLRRDS